MAIIKQTDLVLTDGSQLQNVGENPTRTYRELLMAIPEQGSGLDPATQAVPYFARLPGNTLRIYRIPHGLSDSAATPRVPDVVIPVRYHVVGDNRFEADVMPIIDGTMAISASGWTADGTYVYLAVANHNQAQQDVRFVVYIEYTHSITTNEFYSGAVAQVWP